MGVREIVIPPTDDERNVLVARKYQIELFERAKKDNVIAALDTGSGKTFISVMLIKDVVAEERQLRATRRELKLTIFLVNLVPLVFQQSKVIKANCDFKIQHLCGEMGVDLWSEKEWKKKFEEYDVLVMTAQIFLNILRHGFISLSNVNLLVFDECHHTSKKHPYNLIMKEFYNRCPEVDRPKIFGMTASPVNTRNSLLSASNLESNLHAKVFTASDTSELLKYVNRPEELAIKYDPPPDYQQSELYTALWNECLGAENFQSAFSSASYALSTLGPWCSDRIWESILEEKDRNKERLDVKKFDMGLLQEYDEEKLITQKALAVLDKWVFKKPELDHSMLSPKVIQLIEILACFKEHNGTEKNFCGIVFVERRHTANVLNFLIKEIGVLDFIKSAVLVGHGTNENGDINMRFKEQNKTIEEFRKGQINLLIATNVAEEGLDIQPCNLVIRFDFFNTLRAYIQSRGRARRKDSKYIVMIEQGNLKEEGILKEMKIAEESMKKWCRMLPEDRALLSYESAVSLIHYYCSSLPGDNYCILQPEFKIEREHSGYSCQLTLPSNAPFRTESSHVCESRHKAKKVAAFKACIRLYNLKALNDHLLPEIEWVEEDHEMKPTRDNGLITENIENIKITEKTENIENIKITEITKNAENINITEKTENIENIKITETMEKTENIVNAENTENIKTTETTEKTEKTENIIDVEKIPKELYITIIKLELEDEKYDGQCYRTLCLLSRKQIPQVPSTTLFFHSNAKILNIFPYSKPIKIELEKLEMLFKFTLRLFTSIVNKEFACDIDKFSYLVAPLTQYAPIHENSFDFIDWCEVEKAITHKHLKIELDDVSKLEDAVIIDYSDNLRRYFVQSICYDLNPLSPIPQGMAIREKGCQNFGEFYKKTFELEVENLDQPLIKVKKISRVMNFLQPIPGALPILKGRTATYVIPEFCKEYSIKASVFRSALLLPSIFTRLDSQLLALELKHRLDLPIDDEFMLSALTTPSANMEMNYERLETLGDSFLKFCVTVRLYVSFPEKHEGQLHNQRIRIICNKTLYRSAKRLRLYEHINSLPFNRRAWRPANMMTITDDPENSKKNRVHDLADKTLADVVEALLGAAYLTGEEQAGLKCARALEVPFDDITEWEQFSQWNKNLPRVSIKDHKSVDIKRIEEICGYTFNNKNLIAEALTHASLPNSTTSCYQRLEFLGDAILDFLTVKYLYEKYPDSPPGIITDLKDASVNNQILGAICEVVGLQKHIIHFSSKLLSAITNFSSIIEDMREKNEDYGEYWSDLEVPKVMSDVIESMLGAIFVDSMFDPKAPQKLFDLWIEPVLSKHVTPDTLKVHPVKKLTEIIQKHGCAQFLLRNITTENIDMESQQCTIFVHDTVVGRASSMSNIRAARKLAALVVLEKIEKDETYLDSVCTCSAFPRDDDIFLDSTDDEELLE
nr:9096_t:CDS:2 [Entrophospora candida]